MCNAKYIKNKIKDKIITLSKDEKINIQNKYLSTKARNVKQ